MDEQAARRVIAEHLGVTPALVGDAARFRDLDADSLDLVCLTMKLEDAFAVLIPDPEPNDCVTVGDALDRLRVALHLKSEVAADRSPLPAREWR